MGDSAANSISQPADSGVGGPAAGAIGAVDALAPAAATWAAQEIVRTRAGSSDGSSAATRYQSESDLAYLIQLLVAALATSQSIYFATYIAWLRTALAARGVAVETIAQSLALILAYFEKHLPSNQAEEVATVVRAGLAAVDRTTDDNTTAPQPLAAPAWPEVDALTERLIAGNLSGARAIVIDVTDRCRDYVPIAVHLMQPVLYRIGDRWHQNRISVTAANAAVEACRVLLVELFAWTAPCLAATERSIVLASVANDRHVIGIQVIAEAFLIASWKVLYLGASVSASSLLHAVNQHHPDVVGLSVSLLQQLPTLKLAVGRLRTEFGSRCPWLIVGGRPTNEIPGIWRWTGADAWSPDAERAVAALRTD